MSGDGPGRCDSPGREDRALLITWLDGFAADTGHSPEDAGVAVDRYLDEQSVWIWDRRWSRSPWPHAAPVVGGVARIGPVYTPPEQRRRGYATTCVEQLSRRIEEDDHVAILYTQLSNPTSNAIYQRIGYEPVLEVLRYRFEPIPVSA